MNFRTLFFSALVFLGYSNFGFGQDFEFQINFVDSQGNKDSILLGYDTSGTDLCDLIFGEIDILSVPLNPELDVRISNEWENQFYLGTSASFQTKKQIISNECSSWFSTIGIEVFANHWPVTVSWDTTLFNPVCRNGSVITSNLPPTWWDVLSPSDLNRQALIEDGEITFTENYIPFSDYGYVNGTFDTISFFWVQFADSILLTAQMQENALVEQEIVCYPNPVRSGFSVNSEFDLVSATMTTTLGIKVPTEVESNYVQLGNLKSGIYYVELFFSDGSLATRKIVVLSE